MEDPEGEHTELDAKVGDTLENQSWSVFGNLDHKMVY